MQLPRCQKFNIKGTQCCLPEGHEGAHEINPFDLQAEPQFSASLSNKTEVRAACDKAAEDWILPQKYSDSSRCRCSDCERVEAIVKEARQKDIKELSRVLERHIASLLHSVRVAAIEESAQVLISNEAHACYVRIIRALKEKPWPPYTL